MNHTQENIPERLRELAKIIPGGLSRALLENAAAEIEQLRAEPATFLNRMAERVLHDEPLDRADCADDCRAMAKKLRGET